MIKQQIHTIMAARPVIGRYWIIQCSNRIADYSQRGDKGETVATGTACSGACQ